MFRPLGSFIPTAVLTDIGLFFDKDQLHKFSLASPKANGLFKSYRMMTYKDVEIHVVNYKFSIGLEDSNIDDTKRKIQIDTEKEDITEKISIFLSTCYSIDEFSWYGQICTKWNYFMINEMLIKLMLKIEIKKAFVSRCSIMVPLPLFLKFLYRHGNIVRLWRVKLPCELVSNKTLSLISAFHILPMDGTNRVVDVNDEFLEGYNTGFHISDFLTKFTIKGISAFLEKIEDRTSFGILASDQMQDAIDFERDHPNERNVIWLLSTDGQKKLTFDVFFGRKEHVIFSINLNIEDTDQFGMLPVPNHIYGTLAQESFVKLDKICSLLERPLPYSQYQMDSLSIIHHIDQFSMRYNIRGENRIVGLERYSRTLKDAQTIIVEILRNCSSIEELELYGIKLDEEFYRLLKPIANNIRVTSQWNIKSALEPDSLREVKTANTGLFGKVKLEFPRRYGYKKIWNRLI